MSRSDPRPRPRALRGGRQPGRHRQRCLLRPGGGDRARAVRRARTGRAPRTRRCSPRSAAATRPPSPTSGEGERVLDLGSGGGIDVLLSARRVGPTGRAFGLDMTDEMLALAQRNAAEAGATNVEFLKGQIEAIPLPADIGRRRDQQLRRQPGRGQAGRLPRDRARAATRRPHRHQRHRGRGRPDAEQRAERGSYVGCIAGALSFAEFARACGRRPRRRLDHPDPRVADGHAQRDRQGDEADGRTTRTARAVPDELPVA